MDIFILLAVCTIISVGISGGIGKASAFDSYTPIIKRVSLSKFERFATNINSENHDNDINIHQCDNKQSTYAFTSRRSFISSSITIAILYPNLNANADELNNLHYKSKADGDEDPLAVFGKSLENMGTDSTNSSGSGSSAKDTSSLSFSDISFPQSTDDTTSPPPDLNKALKERKDSQKRSVDPRTHG